jgi:hypothetical protein
MNSLPPPLVRPMVKTSVAALAGHTAFMNNTGAGQSHGRSFRHNNIPTKYTGKYSRTVGNPS